MLCSRGYDLHRRRSSIQNIYSTIQHLHQHISFPLRQVFTPKCSTSTCTTYVSQSSHLFLSPVTISTIKFNTYTSSNLGHTSPRFERKAFLSAKAQHTTMDFYRNSAGRPGWYGTLPATYFCSRSAHFCFGILRHSPYLPPLSPIPWV